jgi:hypothetical protein
VTQLRDVGFNGHTSNPVAAAAVTSELNYGTTGLKTVLQWNVSPKSRRGGGVAVSAVEGEDGETDVPV